MKILPSLILGLATAETIEFHRLKTNPHSARLQQAVAAHGHRFDNSLNTLVNAWDKFKKMYNKVYHEAEQDMKKLEVWLENFAHIEDHNMLFAKGESTYALEMNEYGDMTTSEFLGVRNGFRMDLMEDRKKMAEEHIAINKVQGGTYMMPLNSEQSLPSKVDWREHGFVTPVKNQGQCGSCWVSFIFEHP